MNSFTKSTSPQPGLSTLLCVQQARHSPRGPVTRGPGLLVTLATALRLHVLELCPVRDPTGRFGRKETPEHRCELIAADQYGVITRDQALEAGMTLREIRGRTSSGRWRKLHPRVYAPSSAPASWRQRLMAAASWAGEGSAISHRSAAALWGFDGFTPGVIELTTARSLTSPAVIVHRSRRLPECDVTTCDGISVTTPTRTLIDIGSVCSNDKVEAALDFGLRRGLTSIRYIRRRLGEIAGPGARGAGVLRSLLVERDPSSAPTESILESRFRSLIRRSGLPPPVTQQSIYSREGILARVDFAYPDSRLLIEVDGWDHHANKEMWQRDLQRNNMLTNLGWRVLRFSWTDVT